MVDGRRVGREKEREGWGRGTLGVIKERLDRWVGREDGNGDVGEAGREKQKKKRRGCDGRQWYSDRGGEEGEGALEK